jgi:prophage antirepressor-like protein
MTDVTPFQFENHSVRVVVLDGEPWFVVLDVCRALEITNAAQAARRIEVEDRCQTEVLTAGGTQQTWVVNESGLYELVFASNKPEARRFRRWVTSEVLPQIRKTGSYSAALTPAEMFLQQAQMMVAQEKRLAALEIEQKAQGEYLDDLGGTIGDLGVRVEMLEENHERVTAIGFANLRKIRSDVDFLRQLGIKAASLARWKGVPISRVHSTVWGNVNAWPLEIWDEAYDTLSRKFGV